MLVIVQGILFILFMFFTLFIMARIIFVYRVKWVLGRPVFTKVDAYFWLWLLCCAVFLIVILAKQR